MAHEDEDDNTGTEEETGTEDEAGTEDENEDDDSDDDSDDGDSDDKKDKPKTELDKAIARRDRALARARRAEKALADATKEKDEDKPDPVAAANKRLVRTSAHGVLRGLGVESKEDRIAVLDILDLSDIDVDEDGADEDAIEDRIEQLRAIFAPKAGAPGRTVPRSVKTKREEKSTETDPDKARYRRIMGARK